MSEYSEFITICMHARKHVCACTENVYLSDAPRSSQDFYLHLELCTCLPKCIADFYGIRSDGFLRRLSRLRSKEDFPERFLRIGRKCVKEGLKVRQSAGRDIYELEEGLV